MEATSSSKNKIIFDPLYGFINLTPLEFEIIHTPFYQRLRWIKQIGFSFYTFPGAEHSRFGHSIGVMNNAHEILKSIGLAVEDKALHDPTNTTTEKQRHQSIRLAALLHDLGTFCFSHTKYFKLVIIIGFSNQMMSIQVRIGGIRHATGSLAILSPCIRTPEYIYMVVNMTMNFTHGVSNQSL